MSAERLEELAVLVNRRFFDVSARLPSGTEILHIRSSGNGPLFVVWRPQYGAYFQYGGPDQKYARLGATAEQTAEEIGRIVGVAAS
ncbi:hypothetical protein [Actinomadura roseirufa]|uniref:hypothetical protein n=1 Tax=Actinomadura roseirufa TaxID=2094049 RepID=UPI001040E8BE|nr:hypothetical protein [Actinomadura roseirufa]